MSKRAEEAAWAWAVKNKLDPYSMGRAFGEGYEQAEKDVWERIEKYLSKRDSSDFATVGWILKNINECKKKIMED